MGGEDTDGVEKGRMLGKHDLEPKVDEETRECPESLSDIPVRARRCAFCTSELAAA
jgi:large conductance mechanosensitive channel